MRRTQNGNQPENNPDLSKGFAAGYVYHSIENHVESIGATSGGTLTPHEFAGWVANLLLSKAGGQVLGHPQHLPQVRGSAPERHALGPATEEVHVRPRRQRTLSAKAVKAISDAQKKRWREAKQAQRTREITGVKPANWLKLSSTEKQRWYRANPGSGKRGHPKGTVHWTQTPKGREYMRKSAAARFGRKVVSKRAGVMPRGFWQAEIGKLLAKGPVDRHQVHEALARRFPAKRKNLFVTFASMKSLGQLVETNGMFSLPPGSTEASNGGAELAAS